MVEKTSHDSHTSTSDQALKKNIKSLQNTLGTQTIASMGFFIITLFYTLYFAREIILPTIFALLLYFLLYPLVKALKKIYVPPQLGAALVMITFFIVIAYGFYDLSFQANNWINKLPTIFNDVNQKFTPLFDFIDKPLEIFSDIRQRLESLMSLTENQHVEQVKVTQPYVMGTIFTITWRFFIEFGMSMIILYFLLASEEYYLNKIVTVLTSLERKKEIVKITRQTEFQVWNYLFARTVINIGLAIVVSVVMYLFDMPNPILWGVITGILEFIPFLGALLALIIVGIVSLVSFSNAWHIMLVPAALFIILIIEGNFIFPYIVGRSLTLNTMTIILSIFFFGWIWGVMGALIAVPLVVTVKLFLDNIYKENLISELLSK